ncbi:SulP family inorganic anion transporter [Paenibacillus yanchengensis]|uniref:SulP family inorganic anion transporter n=1 Tax=Paenibacillus yanchengensis TaxID=2035833 RepID=A0ABW4YM88_9BACL
MKWTGRFTDYNLHSFQKDLISGIIVGIIAIPLGMAFAIAAGVKPEYGIYTTIIAGIIISLFGGSKFQIGGPTGAFIPILFAIVLQHGYENLLLAGLMAGIILVLMGVFKLGVLIKFIPRPVIVGFTSGIAVIIFSGQIANLLGLSDIPKHENFLPNMREIIMHMDAVNLYSILIAFICLISIFISTKLFPKIPSSLVGLLVSSIVAALFFSGQVATIGSAYGAIPSQLPQLQMPVITMERVLTMLQPAIIIALLGGIESLLSAVVADGMTGSRHNSNRELIGQGVANIVTPLFGGIPATGAIARTATNIRTGAVSPMSGIIHGVVVLLILMLFAPYASAIPLASMAPILMIVAWNMSERKTFAHVLKTKTSDSLILVVTFLLTVFTNITIAVQVGLVLAIIIFVKRMADVMQVDKVELEEDLPHVVQSNNTNNDHISQHRVNASPTELYPDIGVYTVKGPLFFGAANMFEQSMIDLLQTEPKVLLLRMKKVPFMDTTGEYNVANLIKRVQSYGCIVLIAGIQPQPLDVIKRTGLIKTIGEQHLFARTDDAIQYAKGKLGYNNENT